MLKIPVQTLWVRGPGVSECCLRVAVSQTRRRLASVYFCDAGPVLAVTDPGGKLGYLLWQLYPIDHDNPDGATLRFRRKFRQLHPWDFYYYPRQLLKTNDGPRPILWDTAADRVARSGLATVLNIVFQRRREI